MNSKKKLSAVNKTNNYDLRKGHVYVLSPSRKLDQELKGGVVCPPIIRKRSSMGTPVRPSLGAKPVGIKGNLSKRYNSKVSEMYIDQLFHVIDVIGSGSFGNVYKARSIEDGMLYAIKIIKRFDYTDPYGEVKRLDMISGNPYCIHYTNAWEEEGVLYIQFELGIMSLADYARKNHNICEEECWDILTDVLKGLVLLHEHGFCHMDIKPDNIMVTYDGKYKLCDFGLLTDLSKMEQMKQIMVSEGDAKYIAREVLQGDISAAGDIFALGISIMELAMDLLLPVYGPRWHNLRECSWRLLPSTAKGRISMELELILNWMMDVIPIKRPTATQLLKVPNIVKRLRARKQRFNYFAKWYNEYQDAIPEGPVIDLTTPPSTPQPEREQPADACTPTSNSSLSPVTTPTGRISSVCIRHSIIKKLKKDEEPQVASTSVTDVMVTKLLF